MNPNTNTLVDMESYECASSSIPVLLQDSTCASPNIAAIDVDRLIPVTTFDRSSGLLASQSQRACLAS